MGLNVNQDVDARADVQGVGVGVALGVHSLEHNLALGVRLRGDDPEAVALLDGLDEVLAGDNLRLILNVLNLQLVGVGVTDHAGLRVLVGSGVDVELVDVLVARLLGLVALAVLLKHLDLDVALEHAVVDLDVEFAVLLFGRDQALAVGDLVVPAGRDVDALVHTGNTHVEVVVVHGDLAGGLHSGGVVDHVDDVLVTVALVVHDNDADLAAAFLLRGDLEDGGAVLAHLLGHVDQAVGIVDEVDFPGAQLLDLDLLGLLASAEVEGVVVVAEVALDLLGGGLLFALGAGDSGSHVLRLRRSGDGSGGGHGRLGLRNRLNLRLEGTGGVLGLLRAGDGGRRGDGLGLGDVHRLAHDGLRHGLGRGSLGQGDVRSGLLLGLGDGRDLRATGGGDRLLRRRDGGDLFLHRLDVLRLGHRRLDGLFLDVVRGADLNRLGHGWALGDSRGRGRCGHPLGLGSLAFLHVRLEALEARLRDGDDALVGRLLGQVLVHVVGTRQQDGDVLAILDVQAGRSGVVQGQVVVGLAGLLEVALAHLEAGPLQELLRGNRLHARHVNVAGASNPAAQEVQGLLVVGQQRLQCHVLGHCIGVLALLHVRKHELGQVNSGALNILVDLEVAAHVAVKAIEAGGSVELAHLICSVGARDIEVAVDAPTRAERGLVLARVPVPLLLQVVVDSDLLNRRVEGGVLASNARVCVCGGSDNGCATECDGTGDQGGHDALFQVCVMQRHSPSTSREIFEAAWRVPEHGPQN